MAHNLTMRADGTAEMAYSGLQAPPWHGLGENLLPGASKEEWARAAGFAHKILSANVLYNTEDGAQLDFDGKVVLYRSDNGRPLSIVSDQYKVVQPEDVLNYFDELARNAGTTLETAGTLYGGKQYWAMANVNGSDHVLSEQDRLLGRLLFATSADGSLQTTVKFIATCVVCNNTLTLALGETSGSVVRVSHRSVFRPEEVNKELGIQLGGRFHQAMAEFKRMASAPLSNFDMIEETVRLFNSDYHTLAREDLEKLCESKPVQIIGQLATEGSAIGADLPGRHGTVWAWLNAVTEYVDHHAGSRSQDRRLEKAWFGEGDKLKTSAYERALMLADGSIVMEHEHHEIEGAALFDQVIANTNC